MSIPCSRIRHFLISHSPFPIPHCSLLIAHCSFQPPPLTLAKLRAIAAADLDQRSMQALEHLLFPCAARADAAAIEVEDEYLAILCEQNVVGVQIGVMDAIRVEAADGASDCAPLLLR